jgi:hypothetical protein
MPLPTVKFRPTTINLDVTPPETEDIDWTNGSNMGFREDATSISEFDAGPIAEWCREKIADSSSFSWPRTRSKVPR